MADRKEVTIHRHDLEDMIECSIGDLYTDGQRREWRVMVTDKLYSTTRWGTVYQYVFQDRDTVLFFEFLFEVPAGESNLDFWGEWGDDAGFGTIRQVFEKREMVINYG